MHFVPLSKTEEPDAAAISEETKQSSFMPHYQEDDLATRDAPTCANCVDSLAELDKYTAMADELMQQLAQSQEKLRLEQARSDKLMQRVIKLEIEQRGEIQPELDKKLDQNVVASDEVQQAETYGESADQVESCKDELATPLQKRKRKRNKKAGKKDDNNELDDFLDAEITSKVGSWLMPSHS